MMNFVIGADGAKSRVARCLNLKPGPYLFYSKYSEQSHILEVSTDTGKFLKNIGSDIFLIREYELARRPLKLYSNNSDRFFKDPPWAGGANPDYYYSNSAIWENIKNHNKIYDSKSRCRNKTHIAYLSTASCR